MTNEQLFNPQKETLNNLCKFCGFPVSENFYFCPNCSKKIKEPPVTMSRQIGIYAFSLFLPPLGLIPGFKYMFQTDPKLKKIGIITVILSLVSTIFMIWFASSLFGSVEKSANQLQQLQNLGY